MKRNAPMPLEIKPYANHSGIRNGVMLLGGVARNMDVCLSFGRCGCSFIVQRNTHLHVSHI